MASDHALEQFYWQRLPPRPPHPTPTPRSGAASCLSPSDNPTHLYMFGGYSGSSRVNDLYRYSFADMSWEEVEKESHSVWPGPRENNGVLVCSGPSVFVFGGYNGHSWLNDLYVFDTKDTKWRCLDKGNKGKEGEGEGEGEGEEEEEEQEEGDEQDTPQLPPLAPGS